jgi:N-acetylglucosamine-6-phosphate deacetylase
VATRSEERTRAKRAPAPAVSLFAGRALLPDGLRERVRIELEEGRIARVAAGSSPREGDLRFDDECCLPGLVDLQANGAAGVAYDDPSPERRSIATRHHLERGTTALLATLVSAPLDELAAALDRLADDVDPAGPVVGIHLEGPFLAPEKSGAHAKAALRDPTPDAVERLLASARGALRMVTLAPERPGALEAVRRFARAGAIVCAGHTEAGEREIALAIEAGLSFVTHVGNASDWPSRQPDPALGYRRSEPGLAGTFLFERRLSGSVILDGRHLHPGLVRALVELRGPDAIALVSDAAPFAGLPPGRYRIGGLAAEVRAAGFATTGEGLAGSVITLADALRLAVQELGLPLDVAVRMASETPARTIGLGDRKGRLATGFDADLLIADRELAACAVLQAGERVL